MFVTRGNILSLLCSTNISYKEKESIIKISMFTIYRE